MKSTFALALLAILLSASSASRAHDAFRYGASGVMTPKDKYMASNFPLVREDEDTNTTVVDLDFDLTATEWGMFSAGLLVGLSTEYSQNLTNDCLADTATLIVAAVHINEYMGAYIESNQTDNLMLAYGLTYTVDGMATLSELDCSDIEHDINEWLTNLTSSFSPDQAEYEEDLEAEAEDDEEEDHSDDLEVESKAPRHIVKSHEDFSMPEDYDTEDDEEDDDSENAVTQTYKIFETINSVLNDIDTILQIIEVGINSSQIVEHWEEEAYYDAGYSVGTSGLGIVILLEEIVAKYKELSEEYDDATDLEEDEDVEDEEDTD